MKKLFSLLFTIFLINSFMFADKSRFYENGKVINTMYVDSEDGLRVRDYPSLKSNRLCGLTHRFPVKIVAIGKEETIDGITAPWVEILIPSYEWKSKTPEYGWVFGGYLSEQQSEFIIPRTKNELTKYLESSFWNLYWEYGGSSDDRFGYFADGKMFEKNKLSESVAIQCIKLGISAKDTPYEEAYNNYWEPIMKEHQKKADGKQ